MIMNIIVIAVIIIPTYYCSFCQIIFRNRKKLPGIFATELIIINFLYCLELIRQLVGCFPAKKERRGTLGPLHVEEEMRHLLA